MEYLIVVALMISHIVFFMAGVKHAVDQINNQETND